MSKLGVLLLALVWLVGPVAAATVKPRDRDRDGLPDGWERRHGLSVSKKSGGYDPDRDRLRNRREHRLRLHPRRADTDRDGLRDRAELRRHRTNPRKADTDGDGVKDGTEVRRGTNPRRRDSDGDGYTDREEIKAGTDPQNPASHPGGAPASPAPSAKPGGFPNSASTGVPAGWTPAQVRTSNILVTTPGAVIQDVQLDNASILVAAPNVTIRRVKLRGGIIDNAPGGYGCQNGMVVVDVSIEPPPGRDTDPRDHWRLGHGGYVARRVEMYHASDGFRVGAKSDGCGPATIQDTFVSVHPPDPCGDWHGDGIQGYDGPALTIRNVTIDMEEPRGCGGTAPFFYPHSQGNVGVDIDRLLVKGGGYPFRLGMPGSVRNLKIVNNSWGYGPIDVKCSVVSPWEAEIVTITSDYQVASRIRAQPCNTEGGN